MSNVTWTPPADLPPDDPLAEDRRRRANLLRTVARIVLVSAAVFLPACFVALFLVPNFPIWLAVLDALTILIMLVVLRRLAQDHFEQAAQLGIVSLSVVMFAAMVFANGTRGPLILLSPLLMLIAGAIGERRYAQPTIIAHIALYVLLTILEAVGVLTPYQIPAPALRWVWIAIFIMAAVLIVAINRQFIAYLGLSLFASRRREESLAELNLQVQTIAATERTAQAQTLLEARQLQEAVREYVAFLERIAAGDYGVVLDVDGLAERLALPQELVNLGKYLKTTVASLVTALNEAQSAQRMYLRQSWASLMEAGRVPRGFRYHAEAEETPDVEVAEDAWLPPMTRAVRSKEVVVEPDALAIPIASGTRAQLIGALGVRRVAQEAWSEDELAMVTTVADQLAQTLENLRLLDETTRRAAREQMAGEITGRIREAVEIEAVLQRALTELGRAFAAERGAAYLTLSEQEEGQL